MTTFIKSKAPKQVYVQEKFHNILLELFIQLNCDKNNDTQFTIEEILIILNKKNSTNLLFMELQNSMKEIKKYQLVLTYEQIIKNMYGMFVNNESLQLHPQILSVNTKNIHKEKNQLSNFTFCMLLIINELQNKNLHITLA